MTGASIRTSAAIALALATPVAVAVLGAGAHGADRAVAPDTVKADSLTAAPTLDRSGSPRYATPAQERAAAQIDGQVVPLPAGGNLAGIRWEEAGAGFSEAEIATVVQYNAFCQWLRAAHDGRDAQTALAVLDDVPMWPGFRDQPDDGLIRQIVAEAHAGSGAALANAVSDCQRSHDREVAYAASRGDTPST